MRVVGHGLGWVGQVLAWSFVLAVAGVLAVTVVVPRLAGATPYTVLNSSMRPGMPPGTLVVDKPVDPAHLGVGEVITYQLKSGEPTVVTHRVVAVTSAINGERTYITQGDANDAPDPLPVRPVQVKGQRWYSLPYLGRVNTLLTGHQRQDGVFVAAGLLLAYAAFMFAGSVKDRRRARRGRGDEPPTAADEMPADREGVRVDG